MYVEWKVGIQSLIPGTTAWKRIKKLSNLSFFLDAEVCSKLMSDEKLCCVFCFHSDELKSQRRKDKRVCGRSLLLSLQKDVSDTAWVEMKMEEFLANQCTKLQIRKLIFLCNFSVLEIKIPTAALLIVKISCRRDLQVYEEAKSTVTVFQFLLLWILENEKLQNVCSEKTKLCFSSSVTLKGSGWIWTLAKHKCLNFVGLSWDYFYYLRGASVSLPSRRKVFLWG